MNLRNQYNTFISELRKENKKIKFRISKLEEMTPAQIAVSKMDIKDVIKGISADIISSYDLWALLLRNFGANFFDNVLDDNYGIFSDEGLSGLKY
jgi:hypothetical protein